MKNIFKFFGILIATVVLTSCVGSKDISVPQGTVPDNLTAEQIERAVDEAALTYNWQIKKTNDHEYIAFHSQKGLSATVKITFTDNSYRITHVSSVGLSYNYDKKTVHSRYNTWVQNLNKSLEDHLRATSRRSI